MDKGKGFPFPHINIRTRCCSLSGPTKCYSPGALLRYRSTVVFLERMHPCLRNFDSTMPSYVYSLFNLTNVPMRVSVNTRNLVPAPTIDTFIKAILRQ